ncbi:hypothetical protein VNO78_01904 [Psophocarpus tetragonolobus]|uniref:Uncharacterized protein n=1 Tax=Psophocarpus tetragonolobus TaxID=3891 RepID=A0AAN9SZZ1_PSOTE
MKGFLRGARHGYGVAELLGGWRLCWIYCTCCWCNCIWPNLLGLRLLVLLDAVLYLVFVCLRGPFLSLHLSLFYKSGMVFFRQYSTDIPREHTPDLGFLVSYLPLSCLASPITFLFLRHPNFNLISVLHIHDITDISCTSLTYICIFVAEKESEGVLSGQAWTAQDSECFDLPLLHESWFIAGCST